MENKPKGRKDDSQKVRLDLISAETIDALGKVLTHGATKYGDNNWREGIEYSRVFGAILRHLNAWHAGEINDTESGLPHLFHALCELSFLVTYETEGRTKELDDMHGLIEDEEIIVGQYDDESGLVHGLVQADDGNWYNRGDLDDVCSGECGTCTVTTLCDRCSGDFDALFPG
jgi:hypothetical protein